MEITCPHCNFSKTVDPVKVPDRPVKVNCPKCRQAFSFDKSTVAIETAATEPAQTRVKCPACGVEQESGDSCSACGLVYAFWQARQQEMAASSTDIGVDASLLAQIGQGAPDMSPKSRPKAGFWIRFVAYSIDSLILGGVQLVLGLILGFSIGIMGDLTAEGEAAMSVVTWLFGAVVSIAYAVFFIGHCGQTPGKMALRIKVIMTDGRDVTYGKAALREILGKFVSGILLGIGYLMVAFDSQKQGLHDKIANTYVIKL